VAVSAGAGGREMSAYRRLTLLFSLTMIGLGVAMIAVTLANGGGQVGFLLGTLFVIAGAARLYVQRGR
jgi:hypothetical protein